MNNRKLKILCLEDSEEDAIIVREQLVREGLVARFVHVANKSEFVDKLRTREFDLILSDYNMPAFTGLAALLISKEYCPEIPFICISGAIGEDVAVELMHLGAKDYILKDNLSKLPAAIYRTVREIEEHETRLKAERLLKESEARYRDIIMSSNDLVWEIDRNWKYCYSSGKIETILGYSSDELIGKTPFDLMCEEEVETAQSAFFKIAEVKGILRDFENWYYHKDGHRVCLLSNGLPLTDKEGNLTGYRGVDKDITEPKVYEQEISKLSRATEQSPVSVLITDLQGNITYANQAVLRLNGYSPGELLGKKPAIFSSGEMPESEYRNLWATIKSGKEWKGEFHNRKKSGELYWESASISPILNEKGEATHFMAIKEDITERKRLINELIGAREKAEASDRMKTAFLNNISHEVRTPLNGILGFSEYIVQPDISQEEKEEYLEILHESSERLLDTITNYMDMSLLVSDNMKVQAVPVNIYSLLEKVYRQFLTKCRIKNLEFVKEINLDSGFIMETDGTLLMKALSLLLDNAVKFTCEGRISVGSVIKSGQLQLFVTDTGPGIEYDAQGSVFKAFMQEDFSGSRKHEGSGLGLSIMKGITELLGGTVRMESVPGKGSAFYIIFPVSAGRDSEKELSERRSLMAAII
ncbi:MAG: PAS domain S-box protein [Bacteroidales bacterium]